MSLLGATILTAIATTVLAVGAIVTAVLAGLAFRKQSQEVGLLLEQNQRDADERRRTQAARVFLGVPAEGDPVSPYVKNASEFRVYEVDVWYWEPRDAFRVAGPDSLGNIMPGETRSAIRAFRRAYPDGVLLENIFLTFTDAEGLDWIRTPTGWFVERRHDRPRDDVIDFLDPVPGLPESNADGAEEA
jgi:hypothetical protein